MGDLIESSSVTPSTTPHSRPLPIREDCWSEEATSTLVDAWGRRYLELNRGNLRQKDWQDVADAVNALHGHTKKTHRTDVQCKNRIDTIKKKYKIEKSRVVSSNATLTSSWPFFERLDALIGSNFNSSAKKHPSTSPPVALPLPPSYRRTPPVSSTPPPHPPSLAVDLPQKRPLQVDDGYFRRNYSEMAAAAAAAESDSEEDEDEEGDESGEEEIFEEGDDDDDDVVEVHEIGDDSDGDDDGVEYEEDDDEGEEDEEEVDNDEGGLGEPESTGRLTSMEGEIDGHEQGEDVGEEDDNGETGEQEQGVEDDGEFDDEEDEDSNAGYLVQPAGQAEVHDAGGSDMEPGNEEDDLGGEEEVDDELQLRPSSSNLKRKRDEDEDDDGEDDDDDVVVEYTTKSSKKHH